MDVKPATDWRVIPLSDFPDVLSLTFYDEKVTLASSCSVPFLIAFLYIVAVSFLSVFLSLWALEFDQVSVCLLMG